MTDSALLQQMLASSVTWNRARLKLLTRLILALLQVRSVNLARLAAALEGTADFDSRYKQLQRFMRHFELPFDELTRLLVKITNAASPFIVVLERAVENSLGFGQCAGLVHLAGWSLLSDSVARFGESRFDLAPGAGRAARRV